jgi:hypothetical protein
MSLNGWYPIFWDSIVVLSSMVQMFMKNGHFKPWRWDHYAVSEWWPPIPSDMAPHPRITDTSSTWLFSCFTL